ncbi:MAG: hypothetical protein A2Z04_06720 [Chloroflexi bacterium RBG_16_57_9]|nr:MAG: hypothetical protein A2Z04_06720 [Chloroflexi bacterium RBG_16_57_9]
MPKRLVTSALAAEMLALKQRTISKLFRQGAFPNAFKTSQERNGRIRIPVSDLVAFARKVQKRELDLGSNYMD